MKQKVKQYSFEILKFFVIFIILANIVSYYKSSDLNKIYLPFESIQLIAGTQYTFPKKRPILIHFWTTWCPICKVEAQNIQRVSKEYDVVTIVVGSNNKQTIQEYLEKNNLDFKVINDADNQLANKFNITVYPTTLIYDRKKNLLFSDVGYTSTLGLFLRMFWANL